MTDRWRLQCSFPSYVGLIMAHGGSVTHWIAELQAGNVDSAQKLWQRYYEQLIRLARRKLGGMPRRLADEDDVVACAFNNFFESARQGKYPNLKDRDDLWKLLVTIADRKAADQVKHEMRLKRGGGNVKGESAFTNPESSDLGGIQQISGHSPTPEFAAVMVEQFELLIAKLEDHSLQQIAMLKLEGHTNDEIAQRINKTTRSVERKLNRIRLEWDEKRST